MAENQPDGTEVQPEQNGEPVTPEGGEPTEPWKLLGYSSAMELVKAKIASDAEAKRMNERLTALETGRDQPAPEPEADDDSAFEQWVSKDPVARKVSKVDKRLSEIEQGVILREQQRDIADKDERDAATKLFLANRHLYGDIATAHQAVLADKRAKEIQRLQDELKKRAANQPDPNVARTVEREVTAGEHKRRSMSESEFDSQVKALYDAGKDREARALATQYKRGEIELKKG